MYTFELGSFMFKYSNKFLLESFDAYFLPIQQVYNYDTQSKSNHNF